MINTLHHCEDFEPNDLRLLGAIFSNKLRVCIEVELPDKSILSKRKKKFKTSFILSELLLPNLQNGCESYDA